MKSKVGNTNNAKKTTANVKNKGDDMQDFIKKEFDMLLMKKTGNVSNNQPVVPKTIESNNNSNTMNASGLKESLNKMKLSSQIKTNEANRNDDILKTSMTKFKIDMGSMKQSTSVSNNSNPLNISTNEFRNTKNQPFVVNKKFPEKESDKENLLQKEIINDLNKHDNVILI